MMRNFFICYRRHLLLTLAVFIFIASGPGRAGAALFHFESQYFYDDANGVVWFENLAAINGVSPNPQAADNTIWNLIENAYVDGDDNIDTLTWRVATWEEIDLFMLRSNLGGGNWDTNFIMSQSPMGYDYPVMVGYAGGENYRGYRFARGLYSLNNAERRLEAWITGNIYQYECDLTEVIDDYAYGAIPIDYAVVADVTFGSAVPVPASILLLGSGCAGLAVMRRRKKRQH